MKKMILLICSILLFVTPMIVSQPVETSLDLQKNALIKSLQNDFTHTVFAEYATTTWCPNCPPASEGLFEVYNSSEYDFHYVTLVSDVNPNAQTRSWQGYFNMAIPSVYIDGGYSNLIGSAGGSTTTVYSGMIEESGMRVVSDVDLETSVSWEGNAKMTITVTATNNQNSFYIGFLKTYVTEIVSRWNDYSGAPYHYGFLDFAVNNIVFLGPQQSKTVTAEWDGTSDHNGITFEDITQDNIKVVSSLFHWMPHLKTGYESDEVTQRFFAFYVDETSAAVPE
ncbi:MAG: hypothetical protein KGY67_04345 [Candidatus Thermoplasmatota archaeon]|nr:hypothetical protein [Candidatus Thermoplasmatota archaeon]